MAGLDFGGHTGRRLVPASVMSHTVVEDAVVRMREQLLELRTHRSVLTSKIDGLARQRTALVDAVRA